MKMRRPGITEPYILKADRESDNPTIFNIRQLSWEEMNEVNSDPPMTIEDAVKVKTIMGRAKEESRELNDEEVKIINDINLSDHEMLHKANIQQAKIVEFSLESIEGALDENNEVMELTTKDFITYARIDDIREIGLAIMALSQPGAESAKK